MGTFADSLAKALTESKTASNDVELVETRSLPVAAAQPSSVEAQPSATAADAEPASMPATAEAPGVAQAIEDAPSTPLGASQPAMEALGAAFSALSESPLSTSQRRAAIFDALVPEEPDALTLPQGDASDAQPADGNGESDIAPQPPPPLLAVPPAALLAAVRWRLEQVS